MENFFKYPETVKLPGASELMEDLLHGGGALRVERVVSWGQVTPAGEWYDQEHDEWVIVMEGEASLERAGLGETSLKRGDGIFLPRHLRHRVNYTSTPCIWLAVHGDLFYTPQLNMEAV